MWHVVSTMHVNINARVLFFWGTKKRFHFTNKQKEMENIHFHYSRQILVNYKAINNEKSRWNCSLKYNTLSNHEKWENKFKLLTDEALLGEVEPSEERCCSRVLSSTKPEAILSTSFKAANHLLSNWILSIPLQETAASSNLLTVCLKFL